MKGICRLVAIEAMDIKESSWMVFKRNNQIYKAVRTKYNGEFFISHITDEREWRYVHPDDKSRNGWDKFGKVVMETVLDGEDKCYPIYHSEWQVILNCLLDKEVSFKLISDFDYKQYATITGVK
jgi:hypothetical protein